jgi:hypothetical protein
MTLRTSVNVATTFFLVTDSAAAAKFFQASLKFEVKRDPSRVEHIMVHQSIGWLHAAISNISLAWKR